MYLVLHRDQSIIHTLIPCAWYMICGLWRETDRRTCSTVFILHQKNTYVIYCRRYYKVLQFYSIIALTAIALYSFACNGQEARSEDAEKKGAFGVDGLHKHIIEWAGGGVSLSSSALFAGHG